MVSNMVENSDFIQNLSNAFLGGKEVDELRLENEQKDEKLIKLEQQHHGCAMTIKKLKKDKIELQGLMDKQ